MSPLGRLRFVKDDDEAQVLVAGEAMIGARFDVDCAALPYRDLVAFDLQCPPAFEDDVDLVPFMWLLAIGLGGDKHVDTELEARRRMDDLVAPIPRNEAPGDLAHFKSVGERFHLSVVDHNAESAASPTPFTTPGSNNSAMASLVWLIVWLIKGTPNLEWFGSWNDWAVALLACIVFDVFSGREAAGRTAGRSRA
jgi:hypothetical protein